MISRGHLHYQLEFCYPNTYAGFVRAVKTAASVTRVGYIGIENIRLFVSVHKGEVLLDAFSKDGNSWTPYAKALELEEPCVEKMCYAAQGYEEELARVFYKAFPHAEEAFYETFPEHQDVLAKLQVDPTSERMDAMMLVYTSDDDTSIDDADGYVSITCDDGTLCIPYDYAGGVKKLQMYRAKFHPETPVVNSFNGVCELCESMWSRLRSITVTSVLRRIDSLVK